MIFIECNIWIIKNLIVLLSIIVSYHDPLKLRETRKGRVGVEMDG